MLSSKDNPYNKIDSASVTIRHDWKEDICPFGHRIKDCEKQQPVIGRNGELRYQRFCVIMKRQAQRHVRVAQAFCRAGGKLVGRTSFWNYQTGEIWFEFQCGHFARDEWDDEITISYLQSPMICPHCQKLAHVSRIWLTPLQYLESGKNPPVQSGMVFTLFFENKYPPLQINLSEPFELPVQKEYPPLQINLKKWSEIPPDVIERNNMVGAGGGARRRNNQVNATGKKL